MLASLASSSTSTRGYQRDPYRHALSLESPLCLLFLLFSLTSVSTHCGASLSWASQCGLWRCRVDVFAHSRLILCDVHFEQVVLVTPLVEVFDEIATHLHLQLRKLLTTAGLLARSLTISHHRSLNLSSTFCTNPTTSALISTSQCSTQLSLSWASPCSGSFRRIVFILSTSG